MKKLFLASLCLLSVQSFANHLSIYCSFDGNAGAVRETVAAYILSENGHYNHVISFPTTQSEGSPEINHDTYVVKNACRPVEHKGLDYLDCNYWYKAFPLSVSLPSEFVVTLNERSYITGGYHLYHGANASHHIGPIAGKLICSARAEDPTHRLMLDKKLGYKSRQ